MSKICVKSRVTNNMVFIPVHLVEDIFLNNLGQTVIRRTGKENIRVYESMDEVRRKVDVAYGTQQIREQQVQVVRETVRHVEKPVYVPVPVSRGYRPESRSDSIIDTAVGIGAGIVLGDIVGDMLGGLFD